MVDTLMPKENLQKEWERQQGIRVNWTVNVPTPRQIYDALHPEEQSFEEMVDHHLPTSDDIASKQD